jgi:phage internal scaffolding protein
MTKMQYITAYQPKKRVQISFPKIGRTKQAHKKESDINYIMAKYQKTGLMTNLKNNMPNYGFATSNDFHTSMNIITKAQSMFDELPSTIRNKFENKPEKFLEFVGDQDNLPEMIELGLAYPGKIPANEDEEYISLSEGANTDEGSPSEETDS